MSTLKKIVALMFVFLLMFGFSAITACAEETDSITKDDLLAMNKSELLETLVDNGLILPEDYATHRDLAESFVYEYTPLIIDGTVDADNGKFNYDQSNEMLHNLGSVLAELGFVTSNARLVRSTYTLQNSTAIGSWSNTYTNYNCYAYAIGKTSGLQPGTLSGEYFSVRMSVSSMADVVLADLETEGYWGMKTTTKPTSLPDEYFKVIAIRKDTDNRDYHFMRLYSSSLNSWSHKPADTQPLKWNYSSPNAATWTNEYVEYGNAYPATVDYESTIYYILYKHEDDPGTQQWSIG